VAEGESDQWRSNNFDFLRFVLATLVIFSHSYALVTGSDAAEPLMRVTRQLPTGDLAVDGFFAISGFLVSYSWFRSRSASVFLKRRFRRIYPGYAVALLICAFVVGPIAAASPAIPFAPVELARIARALVTLRGDVQRYAFLHNPVAATANGSLWTIFYEVVCYIAMAILGVSGLIKNPRVLIFLLVASITSCTVLTIAFPLASARFATPPAIPFRLASFFLAGMVAYAYRDKLRYSNRYIGIAIAGLVVGAVIPRALLVVLPVFGTYLLLAVAFSKRLRLYRWASRGDFSYGIYLYAFPIQQLCVKLVPSMRPLALFCLAAPLSIVAGALSWHLVEKRLSKSQVGNTKVERSAAAA
jgi:peptidoglycan/LPS O-acetylase OafA/YrhL